jgi:hypothetical protein
MKMMEFKIEQVAIAPRNPAAAKRLLADMGVRFWIVDHVTAKGKVGNWSEEEITNEADLSFNYDLITGKEFEMLHYTKGVNWLMGVDVVSHFGMHCTETQLTEWKQFFAERNIPIAQEVHTQSHTNPEIVDRRYHYVIFETRPILGVDLKFIVRKL